MGNEAGLQCPKARISLQSTDDTVIRFIAFDLQCDIFRLRDIAALLHSHPLFAETDLVA